MENLENVKKIIARVLEGICMILIMFLTILSIGTVILRYGFNIVFVQTEELITFLFIAVVFLGSVPVMYEKEHVSVSIIQVNMPKPVQKMMSIFQYVVIALVHFLLIYASVYWIATNMNFLTPGLRIPYWTIYVVVPIGCFLSGIIALIDLIEMFMIPEKAIIEERGR